MLKIIIDHLNTQLEGLGFFNVVHCLAEKIEREGKVYPGVYNGSGEYVRIDLDPMGSVSYWRKNSDVTFSTEDSNLTACGILYRTNIPLRLIGFMKKDNPYNDQYFADNIIGEIIGTLTDNTPVIKKSLKAKSASIVASKYSTDWRATAAEEYDNIDFEARYTHAYFSIDFNVSLLSSQNCFNPVCINSQGALLPGTANSLNILGEGLQAWSNVNNVKLCDGSFATYAEEGGDSYFLVVSNFGFSIPSDANILGIIAEVKRYCGFSSDTQNAKDAHVYLTSDAGAMVIGDDMADLDTNWPLVSTSAYYGDSADNWNAGLTPALINASGFGLAISVTSDFDCAIDCIKITVYYN